MPLRVVTRHVRWPRAHLLVLARASAGGTANAGLATATATAYPATVTVSGVANAGLATSTAVAYAVNVTIGAIASAGLATSTAVAYPATAIGATTALAGLATSIAVAYPASAGAASHNITVGEGYSDVSPKHLIRTSADRLYIVTMECDAYPFEAGDRLFVYRADQTGIPSTFTQFITGITDASSWGAAIDGSGTIHIIYQTRAGNLIYNTWNTSTDTLGSGTTVDTGLDTNLGQGDETVAITLDSSGIPHIAYAKTDGTRRRLNYRNRSGGTWSGATVIDDQSFGANQKVWHPNIITLASGDFLFAWHRGAFNGDSDGTLFTRRRTSGGTNQTTANVSGASGARTSIDQSASMMQTANGTIHLTWITATNDYIRYNYSTDGDSWTANNPGSGTQVTHNPSLGPNGSGGVRIYGHGTPASPPDGHGDDLYSFSSTGGAGTWGAWTLYTTGTFDSSVTTRWAQHFMVSTGTLDVAYWNDSYPNVLHYGADQVSTSATASAGVAADVTTAYAATATAGAIASAGVAAVTTTARAAGANGAALANAGMVTLTTTAYGPVVVIGAVAHAGSANATALAYAVAALGAGVAQAGRANAPTTAYQPVAIGTGASIENPQGEWDEGEPVGAWSGGMRGRWGR